MMLAIAYNFLQRIDRVTDKDYRRDFWKSRQHMFNAMNRWYAERIVEILEGGEIGRLGRGEMSSDYKHPHGEPEDFQGTQPHTSPKPPAPPAALPPLQSENHKQISTVVCKHAMEISLNYFWVTDTLTSTPKPAVAELALTNLARHESNCWWLYSFSKRPASQKPLSSAWMLSSN